MSDREARLDQIREEALRGAVDGAGLHADGGPQPVGYYGLPVLKPPVWTWEVPVYFFVGGAAGGAAMLASAFEAFSTDWECARDARWIAFGLASLSPPLLISDLGRPERFYNMFRVFKWQSPMSVGSWALGAFGGFSAASVAAHQAAAWIPSLRFVAHAASVGAALSGAVVATYTGVLLGATAIPAWSSHATFLPVHFGVAGMGSAVGLLELAGNNAPGLQALGIATSAVETVLAVIAEGDADPAVKGLLLRAGGLLCGPVSLGLRLLGRGSRWSRVAAGVAFTSGALLSRFGWIEAGRVSARDPEAVLK
ncbi:MAG: polysulfide reductase [Armatimonadetes bacterium]|nr:polysulfide reductase [Armatimonadota bacterium]